MLLTEIKPGQVFTMGSYHKYMMLRPKTSIKQDQYDVIYISENYELCGMTYSLANITEACPCYSEDWLTYTI